jgi:hypothetical protein
MEAIVVLFGGGYRKTKTTSLRFPAGMAAVVVLFGGGYRNLQFTRHYCRRVI